jgi:hypothetical protein
MARFFMEGALALWLVACAHAFRLNEKDHEFVEIAPE